MDPEALRCRRRRVGNIVAVHAGADADEVAVRGASIIGVMRLHRTLGLSLISA